MAVFVLDQHHRPLMPCSEKRARLLLTRGRAVVHRRVPFAIRLKDRLREESAVQDVAVKLDPGSKTTGLALVRVEQTEKGEVHHALLLANLSQRGDQVHHALMQRASYRRRRRTANLRHRPARFLNRRRAPGWLAPSLRSRIGTVLTWVRRLLCWTPTSRLDVERVKFDTHLLHNPEVAGMTYQRGELFGWEIRAYLLEKFARRCVYCGRGETAFELDHVLPRGAVAQIGCRISCSVATPATRPRATGPRPSSAFRGYTCRPKPRSKMRPPSMRPDTRWWSSLPRLACPSAPGAVGARGGIGSALAWRRITAWMP